MVTILSIDTPTLGDRSYLAHDGQLAAVIDPQRDFDRVEELAASEGVKIVAIFETHLHNDYLTGGLALAKATGASYYVNAADQVSFDRTPISDGDVVEVGSLRIRAIATPGHTFTHLSYALSDPGGDTGGDTGGDAGASDEAVFTGGSLLFGSTGRPDLLGPEHTDTLANHQYDSAHRLATELPDSALVMPTHGFGSFCSATQTGGTSSTIGQEKAENPALTQDRDSWIEETLAGLDVWPAYYAHMGPGNAAGPSAPDLSPPALADKAELARRLDAGEWLVDLRNREVFAAEHAPGTFNFGIDGQFATYLGWLIPWGTPLTLLGSTPEQVAEAQRELVRIGIDRPAAAATGSPADWAAGPLASFARATFRDLAEVRHHRPVTVIDVRRAKEFAASHIEGAVNLPLHSLPQALSEAPEGELWVHCAAGYRASIAASLLAAAGRHVVAIDDTFESAQALSLAP